MGESTVITYTPSLLEMESTSDLKLISELPLSCEDSQKTILWMGNI